MRAQVPTPAQVRGVSAELARRSTIPPHVKAVLESLPVSAHPMTQFITAITALQVRQTTVSSSSRGTRHTGPLTCGPSTP